MRHTNRMRQVVSSVTLFFCSVMRFLGVLCSFYLCYSSLLYSVRASTADEFGREGQDLGNGQGSSHSARSVGVATLRRFPLRGAWVPEQRMSVEQSSSHVATAPHHTVDVAGQSRRRIEQQSGCNYVMCFPSRGSWSRGMYCDNASAGCHKREGEGAVEHHGAASYQPKACPSTSRCDNTTPIQAKLHAQADHFNRQQRSMNDFLRNKLPVYKTPSTEVLDLSLKGSKRRSKDASVLPCRLVENRTRKRCYTNRQSIGKSVHKSSGSVQEPEKLRDRWYPVPAVASCVSVGRSETRRTSWPPAHPDILLKLRQKLISARNREEKVLHPFGPATSREGTGGGSTSFSTPTPAFQLYSQYKTMRYTIYPHPPAVIQERYGKEPLESKSEQDSKKLRENQHDREAGEQLLGHQTQFNGPSSESRFLTSKK